MWLCSPLRFCDKSNTCGGGFPFRRKAWWGRSTPHGALFAPPEVIFFGPVQCSRARAGLAVFPMLFSLLTPRWQLHARPLRYPASERPDLGVAMSPWPILDPWTHGSRCSAVRIILQFHSNNPLFTPSHLYYFFFKLNTIFQLIGEDPSD
jgi:hypothetical protein